ncbi:exonuclease mut-7 homolog isoform X3 [Scylla paramamosain]|uniref:exonuclease mut-7 homolog isoform X3 n=1 Tax=Scylla paramamosain TaxID=85552 RepID=UPI003082FDF4
MIVTHGSRNMETCTLTSDEEYSSFSTTVLNLFKENKKDEFKKHLREYLARSSDPYRAVVVCIKLCPGLFNSKSNTCPANILVELERYTGESNNKEKFSHCLTEDLQVEAYEIAIHQKNTGVIRLFVRCFQLVKIKDFLIPLLRTELNADLKRVCLMATLLGVQNHFSTSELILPLFLTNHLSDADEFLGSSPFHQKELVLLLDGLLGEEACSSDPPKSQAKNVKNMRDPKVICDTIGKLLKKFDFSSSMCPHFMRYRALGGLRFMFYKYYIAKDMPKSAFYSLINDTVKEHPDISSDLLKLFIRYIDFEGAIYYVAKLNLSEDDTPDEVIEHMRMYPDLLEASKHYVVEGQLPYDADEEETSGCYSLTVSEEDIILVDTIEEFEMCAGHLKASPLLSVDAEWKPTFGTGPVEHAALLQFATATKVFLLDLIVLQPLLKDCHWQSIGQLFANPEILKLGYGIRSDFKVLSNLHEEMKRGISCAKKITDLNITKGILLERYPNIFVYSEEKHKGLSDLVYRCFGKPLDKREGFSNWAARPLNKSQVIYAAGDVRSLIDIYNYLNERAKELGVSDWINLEHKGSSGEKKKTVPPKEGEPKNDVQEKQRKRQQPINASDFVVICDNMLQGLAKKLRSCGVDAEALENEESWDRCYRYYERERRTVLTRGNNYHKLIKYIPAQFVYSVQSELVQEQLEEVIEAFSVKVTLKDVFARCSKCNSKKYIVVPSSIISAMQSGVTSRSEARGGWVECEGGDVNVLSGYTGTGVRVRFESVPVAVVETNDPFYICYVCGKCYWEGSHHKKILSGRLKDIVLGDDEGSAVRNTPGDKTT